MWQNYLSEKKRNMLWLYVWMLVLKASIEYSYISFLAPNDVIYSPLIFNEDKYLYGLVCLTILFWGISHKKQTASSFFLQMLLFLQMVPLTVVYALCDESTIYYSCVCAAVIVCECLVAKMRPIPCDIRIPGISQERIVAGGFCLLIVLFIVYVYLLNGLPTLTALNLMDVYKVRLGGNYQLGQYGGFLQILITKIVVPVLLTKFFLEKRWGPLLLVLSGELVIYLYSGHKTFLFAPALVLCTVFFASREGLFRQYWKWVCGVLSVLCVAVPHISQAYYPWAFLVWRSLLNPAANSFHYFDFFSEHPLEGLARVFPSWLFSIESHYGIGYPDGYGFQISAIYYDSPAAECNNGFLSEGFMRWGYIGIFALLILFAILLKLADGFQEKMGYAFAVGCGVYIIFGLADIHVLRGYVLAWVLLMMVMQCKGSNSKTGYG